MNDYLQFVIGHGYTVVFFWVLLEHLGVPVPAVPVLLAAGALAGTGYLNLAVLLAVGVVASLLSDSTWFTLGRRRGGSVLNLVCRLSLEPDSCVRATQNVFARFGAPSLLVVKFVPGLSAAAAPLAGAFRMRLSRFLFFDAAGALLWMAVWTGLGYVFSDQLERVARAALQLGTWLVAVVLAGLAAYIAGKVYQRRRFLRALRIARITPAELRQKLAAGEPIAVIDLRHSVEFDADPAMVPGALRFPPEEIEHYHDQVPRDRDVVLYCT